MANWMPIISCLQYNIIELSWIFLPLGCFGEPGKKHLQRGWEDLCWWSSPSLCTFLWSLDHLPVGLRGGIAEEVSSQPTCICVCFPPPWAQASAVVLYTYLTSNLQTCSPPSPAQAHPQHVQRFPWSQTHMQTITPSHGLFSWAKKQRKFLSLSTPRQAHVSCPRMTDISFSGDNHHRPHPSLL